MTASPGFERPCKPGTRSPSAVRRSGQRARGTQRARGRERGTQRARGTRRARERAGPRRCGRGSCSKASFLWCLSSHCFLKQRLPELRDHVQDAACKAQGAVHLELRRLLLGKNVPLYWMCWAKDGSWSHSLNAFK